MATDFSQLDPLRANAESTAQTANEFGARGVTLADELRKAVGERFKDSPVAQEAATARSSFMSSAPQIRSELANLVTGGSILSPSQQQAIQAAKRSTYMVPLISSNINQEAMFGTLEDLINAGTNAFKAKTTEAQGAASLAQTSYSSMLNELLQRAQEERAAEMQPYDIAYKQALINQANEPSATEKTKNDEQQLLTNMQSDARNMSLQSFVAKYTGQVDVETIYRIYGSNHPGIEYSADIDTLVGNIEKSQQTEATKNRQQYSIQAPASETWQNSLLGRLSHPLQTIGAGFQWLTGR